MKSNTGTVIPGPNGEHIAMRWNGTPPPLGSTVTWAGEASNVEPEGVSELLPCPFCGGKADPEGWSSIDRKGPACDTPGCGGAAETVEIWNTRPTLSCIEAGPGEVDDEDLASDDRWNAGVNYAIKRLCEILGVDPKSISWDAATETLDGDVMSVICNVMVAAYGEEWSSNERDTAIVRAALSPIGGEAEPVAGIVREIEVLLENCHVVEDIDIAAQHVAVMILVKRIAALSYAGVEAEPVAWQHCLADLDGYEYDGEVTTSEKHPFGRPGRDYDASFTVVSRPLYARPQQGEAK